MGDQPEGEAVSLELVERQVADIMADLDLHSYYQLLEVEPEAEASEAAYNHELMVSGYKQIQDNPSCSEALRRNLTLLCQRLDEARRVLCDEQLRWTYDGGVELGELRLSESSLHPITRRTLSGQLTLADFDLVVSQFDPAPLLEGEASKHAPEPALAEALEDEETTQPQSELVQAAIEEFVDDDRTDEKREVPEVGRAAQVTSGLRLDGIPGIGKKRRGPG